MNKHEGTSNLQKLCKDCLYNLGEVTKIHTIGEFTIVEYLTWLNKGDTVLTGQASDTSCFSCYIGGNEVGMNFPSLDAAIIGCVAYKYGGDGYTPDYICKILGVNTKLNLPQLADEHDFVNHTYNLKSNKTKYICSYCNLIKEVFPAFPPIEKYYFFIDIERKYYDEIYVKFCSKEINVLYS